MKNTIIYFISISGIALLLLTACQPKKQQENMQENKIFPFYLGTYTTNESRGIYKYLLRQDGSMEAVGLAAKSENPSFLAISTDKRFLVAVNETNIEGTGSIESFLIAGDSLELISRSPSGGAHPCYVSISKAGFVLASNYTGGNVALLKMDEQGRLSGLLDLRQHTGHGISPRQQVPHAHSACFAPDGNDIVSADLGSNDLWIYNLDSLQQKLIPSDPPVINMNPGAGPRHMIFHPGGKWLYVVNELDCTITLLQKDKYGKYEKDISISTLPPGYTDTSYCADIHISADAKFVYASNRGHNSIAVFEVNSQNGHLRLLEHQDTRGKWPRSFCLSPDDNYLLVANQHSNNIVSFKRDIKTGLLNYMYEINAPDPVCVLF